MGVSADFATSQLTTERPQILLPLPEALAPTVHLIARGAPGDEPKLKPLESALRELGLRRCPVWRSPASSPDKTSSKRAWAI